MAVNRKIAFIDLDTRHIETTPVPDDWRQKFIGGRGVGTYLACKHTQPGCDALAPGNTMVISAGLLAGTLSSPSAATCLITKSPLTGFLECALLPGPFAAEMRWAGFDHLVITGCAEQPVSLFIHNGSIKVIEAGNLKGYGVARTCASVRKALGDQDLKVLAIGPAGENLVRFATITNHAGRATGRTGMGAVLGSKRIKALACRGTLDVEIKFPEQVIEHRLAGKSVIPETQPARVNRDNSAIAFRDLSASMADRETTPESIHRMADYGLDPQAVMFMADRAAGGRADDLLAAAEQIALREGPGDTLAEGAVRHSVNTDLENFKHPDSLPDLISLYREELPAGDVGPGVPFFAAPDRSAGSYRGKPGTVAHRELSDHLLDCLGDRTCAGICPVTGRLDMARAAEMIRLNTGLELKPGELQKSAYRCYALERFYNLREEKAGRLDGSLEFCLDVPGEIKMSREAWDRIDLKAFRRTVAQYYRQNGWDRKTIVKKKVLERLGVGELWNILK